MLMQAPVETMPSPTISNARRPGLAVLGSVVIVGFIAARLGFVWTSRGAFTWTFAGIVDARDQGVSVLSGILGAWLYALVILKRRGGWRLMVITAIWLAGLAWGGTMLYWVNAALREGRVAESPPLLDVRSGRDLLDHFNGKPTLVNLWASWCPPCIDEMALLQKLQVEHPEINVVFLNQGEPPLRIASFLASHSLNLANVIVDPRGDIGREIDRRDLGSTLLLGTDGHAVDFDALPRSFFFSADGWFLKSQLGELSADMLASRLLILKTPAAVYP